MTLVAMSHSLTSVSAMSSVVPITTQAKGSFESDSKIVKVYDNKALKAPSASTGATAIAPSFAIPTTSKAPSEPVAYESGVMQRLFLRNLAKIRSQSDFYFLMYDHNLRTSQQQFPELRKIHVERMQACILEGAERVKNPKAVWILAPSVDLELPLVEKLSKFEKIYLIGMNSEVKNRIPEHLKHKVQWVECDLTGSGKEEISKLFARAESEQWDKDRAFEESIKLMSNFQSSHPSFPSELPSYLVSSLVLTDIGNGLQKILANSLQLNRYYEEEVDEAYLDPEAIAEQRKRKLLFQGLGVKFEQTYEEMNKRLQLQFLRLIGKGIPDVARNLELIFFADTQSKARYTFMESGQLNRSEETQLSHFSHLEMLGALCDIETRQSSEYIVSPPKRLESETGMVLDVNALYLRPKRS